jgi:hypothetical protein
VHHVGFDGVTVKFMYNHNYNFIKRTRMSYALNGSMKAEQRGERTRSAKLIRTYNGITSVKPLP